MNNSKRIIYLILVLIMYLLLDYFNILTRLNIYIKNINLELFNILVIIFLYIITFYFIDQKQLKKENNKVEISKIIFKRTYEMCLSNIELLTDEIINDIIIQNFDFDELLYENKYMNNLLDQPFQNEKMILELLKDGVIPRNLYEDYLNCKENYRSYLNTRIMFYDKPEFSESKKEDLVRVLTVSLESLNN